MTTLSQRLAAFGLAVALAAPVSLFADSRPQQRTDMNDVARDLEKALGPGHVTVSGGRSSDESHTAASSRTALASRTTAERTHAALDAQSLVDDMNRERVSRGLKPLRLNSALSAAAHDRVNDMLANHYFNHISPSGLDPFSWADRHGYDYRMIGENLATGYPTSADVVDGWMHSPGHRKNILTSDFDEVGIGVTAASPTHAFRGPLVVAIYGAR